MTTDEQLAEWLKGNPIHNQDRGECCPDFSCCNPQLLAPAEVREVFVKGNSHVRSRLLGEFLSRAFADLKPAAEVYIAGLDADRMELEG